MCLTYLLEGMSVLCCAPERRTSWALHDSTIGKPAGSGQPRRIASISAEAIPCPSEHWPLGSVRRIWVRGPSARRECGEQASCRFFGVGGAHDLTHDRNAARPRSETGGKVAVIDTAERDHRAGRKPCRLGQRVEPDRGPVAGLAPGQENRAQRRVIGAGGEHCG